MMYKNKCYVCCRLWAPLLELAGGGGCKLLYFSLAHLSWRLRMIHCDHSPSVCLSTPLNNFSSETPGPIFFKLHVEPSVKGGFKIFTNGYCQMAAMPVYMVKILRNLFQNQESFEAESWCIGDSRSTKFVQSMTLGWPLTFLWQGQICIPMHLYAKNIENHFLKMF